MQELIADLIAAERAVYEAQLEEYQTCRIWRAAQSKCEKAADAYAALRVRFYQEISAAAGVPEKFNPGDPATYP